MRFSDPVLIAFVIMIVTGTASAQSRYDFHPTVQRLYGQDAHATAGLVKIDGELASRLSEQNGSSHPWSAVECWRIAKGTETVGWALVDNVKGKSRPITYIVCFDAGGSILDVDILEYRESHGGEVASEMFRKQFRGKSDVDVFLVGRTIRNISGATISVRSVTRGTRALTTLARHLITNGAR